MRFCEGKPERVTRGLDAPERLALSIATRRSARKAGLALGLVAAPLLLVVAALVVAAALGADPEGAAPALGALAVVAVLGALPAAIAFARDALRAARALRRDLRRGEVWVFGDGVGEVVVLAESVHVVRRGGALVAPVRRVAVGEAAPPPSAPATYALSTAETPPALRAGAWVKRALSPDERAELEAHARRFDRVSALLVLVTLVFGAGAAANLSSGRTGAPLVADVAVLVLLGLRWLRVYRDRRAAAGLRADADEGWAYRGAAGADDCEVLPASGAFWTAAGAPAEWRLHHPR